MLTLWAESEKRKNMGEDMKTTLNAPNGDRSFGRGSKWTAEESRPVEETGAHRVLLVEDHASFRQAMAIVFGGEPDFGPVSEAGSLAEAKRMRASGFDLAVVDLGLPDGGSTLLIRALKEGASPPAVLVLTASLDSEAHALAIEAGADGVIHKSAEIDEILAASRRLLAGGMLHSPAEMVDLLRLATKRRERDGKEDHAAKRITRREREVLQALSEGLSKKEIAKKLNIAVETEHTHMTNIFDKIGAHTRLEAFLFAARHGIVEMKKPKN